MGNRVYLSFTNFDHYPSDPERESFSDEPGAEYEARACIPLFWLCLFDTQSIVPRFSGNRRFPGLLTGKGTALLTARRRLAILEPQLGPARVELYEQWLELVRTQPQSHLVVATLELDWMDAEGALESALRRAFDVLDGPVVDSVGITTDWRVAGLVGLTQHRSLNECESFELVSADGEWPKPFAPATKLNPPANPVRPDARDTFLNSLPPSSLAQTLLLLVVSVSVGGVLTGLGGDMKGYVVGVFFGLCAVLPALQLRQRLRDARRHKLESPERP